MPESCWRNFLTRTGLVQHWTDFCGKLTQLQGLQTGNPSAAENVRSVQKTSKCLCKWWPLWAQTVTNGVAYELLRRLFHIGNFCFWAPFFKQLLLKNCAVDFVEICNVCIRKVIFKAAKMICNSDKICCSYYDFYFGVTFFGTHCIYVCLLFDTPLIKRILIDWLIDWLIDRLIDDLRGDSKSEFKGLQYHVRDLGSVPSVPLCVIGRMIDIVDPVL